MADVQAQPGALDAGLAHVSSAVEWLQHERAIGLRDADSLIVNGCRQPFRGGGGSDRDRRPRRRILEGIADQVLEDLTDTSGIDLERRQVVVHGSDQATILTGRGQVTAQTRDQRREQDRAALEDQWIGLQMSDVQDFLHQCGESLGGLVDSLQVMPLLAGLELPMQEGVGGTPNARQPCSALVADGGEEYFEHGLERWSRRGVLQRGSWTYATLPP